MAEERDQSFDEQDWNRPMMGSGARDTVLERRSLVLNNGAVPVMEAGSAIVARGKFFTRGMRGFLETIEIYCADPLAAGGTIEVHISPFPESGTSYTANIVVPAGGAAAWRAATFNLFWNYDSMFIWWSEALAGDVEYAYDLGLPWDAWGGSPTGIIWLTRDMRYWVRVLMAGETPGDVPVSGTVNSIVIPNLTAEMAYTNTVVNAGAEQIVLPRVFTMGKLTCLMMTLRQILGAVPPGNMVIHIETDGVDHTFNIGELREVIVDVVNTVSPISMGLIDAVNNIYQVNFSAEFPFRQTLVVSVENTAGAGNNIRVHTIYQYEIIG